MDKKFIISIVAILVLVGAGFWMLRSSNKEALVVTNFTECEQAGYPVMESMPRQCKTPDGKTFTEGEVMGATGGCYVGGCSGQICSDQEDVVTDCMYREEYACYQSATCERQASGACGWTDTDELALCLNLGVEGK